MTHSSRGSTVSSRHATIVLAALALAALTLTTRAAAPVLSLDDENPAENPASLSQMLQWSLEHQDLAALHAKAEAIRAAEGGAQRALPDGDGQGPQVRRVSEGDAIANAIAAAKRQKELGALFKSLMPDRVGMMRGSLERALATEPPTGEPATELQGLLSDASGEPLEWLPAGASLATGSRLLALRQLEELVEDIDSARDFAKIGGFAQLLPMLDSPADGSAHATHLRGAVAWVFGTAAQNEPDVQAALLELGVPSRLFALLLAPPPAAPDAAAASDAAALELACEGARSKALFALSAICRSSPAGARALLRLNGFGALALAVSDPSLRVARKALTLLADLAALAANGPCEEEGADTAASGAGGEAARVDTAGEMSGEAGSDSDWSALALEVGEAIEANGTALCTAIALHLTRGAEAADLDVCDKAFDAASAVGTLLEREGLHVGARACAHALGPALRAVAGRAGVELATTAASAPLAVEVDEDEGDGGRATLWARLRDGARELASSLDADESAS
ncbi:armadillo-type protein [Pavlovales sp. CCMP2436]|nr:armadillo-type protein [Pavlovales sp. CCMP2436]|mmetsp:Transcript_49855/g.114247  ORF Transcript_49855/g.114247 Transcript_49855/m.114247 type:complete len:515 (+) Transcript_49855:32-1576(+)